MHNIISKDGELNTSPVIVGYKVMHFMNEKKVNKISIFDIADHFKNYKWFTPKNLYFGMIFLYSLDIIDFENSFVVSKQNA